VVAPVGCWDGGERERERGGRNQEEASFLAYFLPDFHHAQTMKSTPIYRG
jgi:hypothetical protein